MVNTVHEAAPERFGRSGLDTASLWAGAKRIARRHPTMVLGIAVLVLMGLMAALAPVLFTSDPVRADPFVRLQPPSSEHWFGTDFVGRDAYSRTLYGSRISLLVGFSVALIGVTFAVVIGLLAGYYRHVDAVVMRIMDGLMAIPTVLLAIALMATLGGSVQNVIIAISVVETPRAVRVVRSAVFGLRELTYVEAARAIGAPTTRILIRHIFPGTVPVLIVQGTFICAAAILVEAILSFLGAGTPPEIPSWGTMMAEGRRTISQAVWVIGFPGMFLTLTVMGINLAGDGLRDLLDPKLSRRG